MRADAAHFGLTPTAIGHGHGGHALTLLIGEAWASMTTTGGGLLWLTTTNRDHPHAAASCRARGFRATAIRPAE